MADWLIETFSAYPYVGVILVFLACGFGAPFPEEIVLMFAGFVCFKGVADRETMMAVCAGAILFGDTVPFALGKIYGPNLLRLRLLRLMITPERLARFDVWFRRRGDAVVFLSRFVPGLRLVSFFTAGSMKMSWLRFLALDGGGILLVAPTFVWIGHRFGGSIEAAVAWVQRVERGILIAALAIGAVIGVWYWLRWRRRQRALVGGPVEAYVEPSTTRRGDESAPPETAAAEGGPDLEETPADAVDVLPEPPPAAVAPPPKEPPAADEPDRGIEDGPTGRSGEPPPEAPHDATPNDPPRRDVDTDADPLRRPFGR